MHEVEIPKAADIMARRVITLRPDQSVLEAMRVLVDNRISGAPVLDSNGGLCGIISEFDCLRILTSGQFSAESWEEETRVGHVMTHDVLTIGPDLDLFAIAQRLLTRPVRRLPVVDDGRLVGLVSRRDVLRGVDEMRAKARRQTKAPRPKGLYLSADDLSQEEISSRLD